MNQLSILLQQNNLVDIYRYHHPETASYTYFKCNSQIASRIDMFLLSEALTPYITKHSQIPCGFSDHYAIAIDIHIDEVKKGKGRWIMNDEVISSALFKNTFELFWRKWADSIDRWDDKAMWWNEAKIMKPR